MTACWEPGTQYNNGDIVEYEGARYKIIQPHRSQGDWTPPITPALWGRVPNSECQRQEPCKPHPEKGGYHGGQGTQQSNDSYQRPYQSSEPPQEEHKKNWMEEHKTELEVGGGLLAAAALAGGVYAYGKHKKGKAEEEEENQGPPPGYPSPDARQRPDEYREHGSGHSFSAGKVGALAAGTAAIGAGGYAYHEHKKNKKGSGSDSDSDKEERSEEYREQGSGHSFGAGKLGALAAGAAAIGVGGYAYHEHKKNKKERGSGSDSDSDKEERSEEYREQGSGHSFGAGKVGALAAGVAAMGVGGYAYHEHEKHKKERTEDEKQGRIQGYPPEPQGYPPEPQGYPPERQGRPEEDREQRHGHSYATPAVAGGVLAGAAAIGVGAYAYHKHEEHKNGPPTWVEVEGRDNIPENAIEAGRDRDNHPIYIARAHYENSLQVGKACSVFREGAAIGYGGRVVELRRFEVLVGDPRAIRWVRCSYQLNLQELKGKPVEGGREANGAPLYVARVEYSGGTHTAKCGEHLPAAHLAYGGSEVQVEDYEVLCYDN